MQIALKQCQIIAGFQNQTDNLHYFAGALATRTEWRAGLMMMGSLHWLFLS
jgi:hypothetical protein